MRASQMETDSANHVEKNTEENGTSRIDLLRSLAGKRGAAKTETEETKPEGFTDRISAQNKENLLRRRTLSSTTDQGTENSQTWQGSHDSYSTKQKTSLNVSKETQNVNEHSKDDKKDIGKQSINAVEKMGSGTNTKSAGSNNETMPRLSLQTMREEIWSLLNGVRNGRVDLKQADAFARGCSTIMRAVKLELDVMKQLGTKEEARELLGYETKKVEDRRDAQESST